MASGLDRDSLIEGMTQGTTSKIYKQQQKKDLTAREQNAIRGITDKMIGLQDKYLSTYSSFRRFIQQQFLGRNLITAVRSEQ